MDGGVLVMSVGDFGYYCVDGTLIEQFCFFSFVDNLMFKMKFEPYMSSLKTPKYKNGPKISS